MKDKQLKLELLEYFVRKKWYPQLEVDIKAKYRISASKKLLTDVDVFGLYPDVNGTFRKVLGDCKTLRQQSPITRVFWMSGLMEYLKAKLGFILLSKTIEKEHQLTSSKLDIKLLSQSNFDIFAKHTENYLDECDAQLVKESNWDIYFSLSKDFPYLQEICGYVRSGFWNIQSPNSQLRSGVALLRSKKKELNPQNKKHLALTIDTFSIISISVNQILVELFDSYLLPETKEDLDQELKAIIWDGYENYSRMNELRKEVSGAKGSESELALPQWGDFLELVRLLLQNPLKFNSVPIFLKEVAFSHFGKTDRSNFLKSLIQENPYLISHSTRICSYLVKAGGLPADFDEIINNKIIEFGSEGI